MKKILLATTLIVAASSAMADITFSGNGRFGLVYFSGNDAFDANATNTQFTGRLRFNINGKTTTDGGVDFGGRVRIQSQTGGTGGTISAPLLFAESSGLRVEFGNANTAIDSVALFYNSEMGFTGSSVGEPGNFYSFSSGPYGAGEENRVGIYAAYSIAGLNLKLSYVNPNQTLKHLNQGNEGPLLGNELSAAVDYSFGQFTVAAAAVRNASGFKDQKEEFVGAAYAVTPTANIGLNYYHLTPVSGDSFQVTTLYGNYTMGAITLRAYLSHNDTKDLDKSTVAAVGADYALGGGATLAGYVSQTFSGDTVADLGVRFDF
jgi:outer membrane protein OmpU